MPGENLGGHNVFGALESFKGEQEKLHWEGSFDDYVNKVTENPEIVRTAYQTAYSAVTSREDFFTTGKNALFGAEESTNRFVETLRGGAQGHEIGKRIVILVGPPGSGKSTLVNGTKRGIEEFSKTDDGAIYAIKDCPMQEEPLHLLPKSVRPMIEENYGIHIDGDLCPRCDEKYGEVSTDELKEVAVERVVFSEKKRVGIGTFKPSDPKSQDISELVGSVDLSKLGEYGTASDARAYAFDGELNVANRGVMEFVEMLKTDEKFLYSLLDLAQDRVIKVPRFGNITADEVILAHTNMSEYESYVKNPKNEALRDRLVVIPVPYSLKVSDEQKIYDKLVNQSETVQKSQVHIAPHSLETAAMFSVLSRLSESKKQYSKLQKLKIYDGLETDGLTQRDLRELKEEDKSEGMSGISPRYVIDALSNALIKEDVKCLTPINTLRALRDNLDHHAHTRDMRKEDRDALMKDLEVANDEYNTIAKKDVQAAFVYSYEDSAHSLCNNYLTNVEAFCSNAKVPDEFSEEELEPDEALMRSIEEQVGISENGKKEFRNELLIRMSSVLRRGDTFDYNSHPRLKDAIEKKLFADMKDMVKLTTSAKVPNEEQKEHIHDVTETLVSEKGYCEHCANEQIRYVGALLSKS